MTVHPTRQEQEWKIGGSRVTRTHHDGPVSGVLTGIRWTSQGLHVCMEGAEAWSHYRCSTFSPCEVA